MQAGRVGAALALAAAALVLWPTAPDARRATGEAFIPAQAVTQPWPIKEFEVINVEPLNIADIDNTLLEALLIRASRLLPHDIEAAGLRVVHPGGDLAAAMADMETMLWRSAAQFERWRFPSLPGRLPEHTTVRSGLRDGG